MNIKTKALDKDQYELIIATIRNGFTYDNGKEFKPNNRLAAICVTQGNIGLRISDILNLRLSDIVWESGRWHLDICEQKTGKHRNFTVPNGLYDFLKQYAKDNHIFPTARLFPITERAVQKNLDIVSAYLGWQDISSHSFRKYYATQIYINNGYDIELVRILLQHSSIEVTRKYIGIQNKRIEDAINNHLCIA